MFTRANYLFISLLTGLFTTSSAYAHNPQAVNMQIGGTWYLMTNDNMCLSINNAYLYVADKTPSLLSRSIIDRKWPATSKINRANCSILTNFFNKTNSKKWHVAKNRSKLTRPVRDIFTSNIVKNVRATVGVSCGTLIQAWNERYTYRRITINNKDYKVVCE